MMISLTALLCPLTVLAIIIVAIVLILRSLARGGSRSAQIPPGPLVNTNVQLADDGFWLSSFQPGSVVHYFFWSANVRRGGRITFQPGNDGRQFVYTGARPDRVEITRDAGDAGGYDVPPPSPIDDGPVDLTAPIIGGMVAGTILDAATRSSAEPPPTPPASFPPAY